MRAKYEIIDTMSLNERAIASDASSLIHDVLDAKKKPVLRASIDATHSGRLTNMRVYPGQRMRKGVNTFLKPVPKPVLKHHRDDEDAIGRVSSAEYIQLKHGEAFDFDYRNPGKGAGSGFIKLGLDIMEADAMEQFADGRIQQFSTRQAFDSAYCSVCGEDITEDLAFGGMFSSHEHQIGEAYKVGKGKNAQDYLCFLITGDLEYREVSAVNIPGDDQSKINGFEIIEPQSVEDGLTTIHCAGDGLTAEMDSLTLTVGSEFVDLLAGGSVTAKDKRKLTGKTVVAVSPSFNDHLINQEEDTTDMKDKEELKPDEEVKDESQNTEEETTETPEARKESGESSTETNESEDQEDVVVPEKEDTEEEVSDHTSGLSSAALQASLEAVTAQLNEAKAEKENLQGKVSRLEAKIAEKDEEIERQKTITADSLAETKMAYAQQLLANRMILKKGDVNGIDSKKDYENKLSEYAERSLDSLKDALSDLGPEITEASAQNGIKTANDFMQEERLENPVANMKPTEEADSEEQEIVPELSPAEELDNYLTN